MQTLSERYATQIFGLAMGAVFAAMLILSAVSYWRRFGSVASNPVPPQPHCAEVTESFNPAAAMKTERFAGHHEASEALVLAIAGVTAINADWEFDFADLVLSACSKKKATNFGGLSLSRSGGTQLRLF
jgi:hypothetical protein